MSATVPDGLQWQTAVWDQMSPAYVAKIDERFTPVIDAVLARADLAPGQRLLDLGAGTGSVALRAATVTGGAVALDISLQMLDQARRRAEAASLPVRVVAARGEEIPLAGGSCERILASLSLMYVIDRQAAAAEIARVLAPGGRMVAAVWAPAAECDIVRFQETAARLAPPPPVPGVGPGALGNPAPFVEALEAAGLSCTVERQVCEFTFASLDEAWAPLAGVTARTLDEAGVAAAKKAVREEMWPDPSEARTFRNTTILMTATAPR